MRYGIISDIHGNLEALETVLQALRELNIDRTVCLGDIVGYGANPNECIAAVQALTDLVVVGNHDHAAIGLTDTSYFNTYARQAVVWTGNQLTKANVAYLRRLPFFLNSRVQNMLLEDNALFVHATPNHPEEWRYILSVGEAQWQLASLESQVCFIGHSHQPIILWRASDSSLNAAERTVTLDPDSKYIINVGSVGQPRDHDPRAAFAIWDTATGEIEIQRRGYDIQKAQRRIRKAGLPEFLANRLEYGE